MDLRLPGAGAGLGGGGRVGEQPRAAGGDCRVGGGACLFQVALTCTQIWWTTEVGLAFARLEEGYENAIKDYNKKQVRGAARVAGSAHRGLLSAAGPRGCGAACPSVQSGQILATARPTPRPPGWFAPKATALEILRKEKSHVMPPPRYDHCHTVT